ncbi:hypothetical protein [Flaviflagellibacter deserti]|uniref:Uncharacterized protein n=1 Tax=Flaviflagellibacter deserti TaxID=2267266 RepID=A0ABV9Z3U3_9HYPH
MSVVRIDGPQIDDEALFRDIQGSVNHEAEDRPSLEALLKLTAQTVEPTMPTSGGGPSPIDGIERGARDLRLATKMLEQTSEVLVSAEHGLENAYQALRDAQIEVDFASHALANTLVARLGADDLNAAFVESTAALSRLQQAVDDLKFSQAWCQSAYASYAKSVTSESTLRDALRKVGVAN